MTSLFNDNAILASVRMCSSTVSNLLGQSIEYQIYTGKCRGFVAESCQMEPILCPERIYFVKNRRISWRPFFLFPSSDRSCPKGTSLALCHICSGNNRAAGSIDRAVCSTSRCRQSGHRVQNIQDRTSFRTGKDLAFPTVFFSPSVITTQSGFTFRIWRGV